jgi:uncharacterized protein involved in exopolysaccharide biosynthesis
MTDHKEPMFVDTEVDLIVTIQTLWGKKWSILGTILLAGLIAFLISSFLLPKRYKASAYITFTDPGLRTELESSIQFRTVELETQGLIDLAESDALLTQTFTELGISDPALQSAFDFSAFMDWRGQLRLRVTSLNPTLAADAANTWARLVSGRFNNIYGTGEETLQSLEVEVAKAKKNWSESQLALETYLPESKLNAAQVQLAAARTSLAAYLHEIDTNQLLISDIQTLQTQIDSMGAADSLSTGLTLSLINLQQRAAVRHDELPLQIQVDQTLKTDLSPDEASNILQNFWTTLESQNQQLAGDIVELESEISDLAVFLETENFKVDELTQQRNLARKIYIDLSTLLEETRINISQDIGVFMVGIEAIEPSKPSGPNAVLNAVLAGLIGGMLIAGGILLQDWWRVGKS